MVDWRERDNLVHLKDVSCFSLTSRTCAVEQQLLLATASALKDARSTYNIIAICGLCVNKTIYLFLSVFYSLSL